MRKDLKWPADLYLEGSDQHRGWFQSSLLEACGTRGRAPFDAVLTHGFVMDELGRKMSKSLGNTVAPQDVIKQSGADILRLWALSSDYTEDLRIGPHIIQSTVDAYRKLRNTLRYLLGNLAHHEPGFEVVHAEMPELERWVLHRVAEIDAEVRAAYNAFDFKKAYRLLAEFCSNDLSAIYFDIRKDTLYCEAYSSMKRRAALSVLNTLFASLTAWLAPLLCFTAEEAWLARHGDAKDGSVHLQGFPEIPAEWRNDALGEKWEKVWAVRRVITGALEVERREKRIGSSLEAAPDIYIGNKALAAAAKGVDWAKTAITSDAAIKTGTPPSDAFTLDEVEGVAVVPKLAAGKKCARSWRITDDVGLRADLSQPQRPRRRRRQGTRRTRWLARHIDWIAEAACGYPGSPKIRRPNMATVPDNAQARFRDDSSISRRSRFPGTRGRFRARRYPRCPSRARNCALCSPRTLCGSSLARRSQDWLRP